MTPAAAAPRVASVSVSAQSGALTAGTAGTATYQVTVTKGDRFRLTANLSVSGLPAGATASFDPNPLVWGNYIPAGSSMVSTLTVDYDGAAPAGGTPFTVEARRNNSDWETGSGTLTVLETGLNPQTITFGAAAGQDLWRR